MHVVPDETDLSSLTECAECVLFGSFAPHSHRADQYTAFFGPVYFQCHEIQHVK